MVVIESVVGRESSGFPETRHSSAMETNNLSILLFIPNIIGYIRIFLTILAFVMFHNPAWFLVLYGASIVFDGFDGYFARKLNQCSDFGAWLDVVVDLFSRGLLWCSLSQYGYLVIFLEWLTFVATHCRGAKWKTTEDKFPWLVKNVMENGFKTAWGLVAIAGINILPLWLYMYYSGVLTTVASLPQWVHYLCFSLLIAGRVLAAYVESFFIYDHIMFLLHNDSRKQPN